MRRRSRPVAHIVETNAKVLLTYQKPVAVSDGLPCCPVPGLRRALCDVFGLWVVSDTLHAHKCRCKPSACVPYSSILTNSRSPVSRLFDRFTTASRPLRGCSRRFRFGEYGQIVLSRALSCQQIAYPASSPRRSLYSAMRSTTEPALWHAVTPICW